ILISSQPIAAGTDEFSTISITFKKAEQAYNLAKVARFFSKEINTDEDRILIIQNLRISELPFGQYVTKRKSEGATEDVIAGEIKEAILQMISDILMNRP
ncbi:unnamed protein product, partial [Phaeothamnion confervicola]